MNIKFGRLIDATGTVQPAQRDFAGRVKLPVVISGQKTLAEISFASVEEGVQVAKEILGPGYTVTSVFGAAPSAVLPNPFGRK